MPSNLIAFARLATGLGGLGYRSLGRDVGYKVWVGRYLVGDITVDGVGYWKAGEL